MAYTVSRRLFHTADKSRVVAEGDPEARFLAFPSGTEISDDEAERLGIPDLERKMAAPPKNKMVRPAVKGATLTKEQQ
jgi:hypothetical protein